jgi:hypothetical protein
MSSGFEEPGPMASVNSMKKGDERKRGGRSDLRDEDTDISPAMDCG